MSFLDRFKRKDSDESSSETTPESTADSRPERGSVGLGKKNDPAVKLAAATVAAGYTPEFKFPPRKEKEPGLIALAPAAPPADNGTKQEVILDLGDFLSRLPKQMLNDEAPDPKIPLPFDIAELADRISRGQTTIALVEIYRRAPGIFRGVVLPSDTTEIRFPWQKVMKMLTAYKNNSSEVRPEGLSLAAAESLGEKLRGRRAARNVIPGTAEAAAANPAPALPLFANAAPIKPPELVVPATNADADEKMSKEEALKARDQLRNTLARIKGEFERHLAAGEQQRKALADERERVIADLARAKKEIDDKLEQVAFEKSVAAKSSDNLTKTQQERDAFKIGLSNLKVELAKAQQNDQRIKELAAERDALAAQQANLSKQVAEFQKRGKMGAMLAAEAAPAPVAERSQKESHRQFEELQRRINILETGQREAAQELGREREAKIKLERQLAAADRLQQESAAKVQEIQATLQRENESAARKRDAEMARTLKEVQEQAATAQAAHQKLQTELEEARGKLAAAQEAASAVVAPEAWEARASSQFEADIESYRARIKTLLQEREALGQDKQKLADELVARTEEIARRAEEAEALTKANTLAKAEALAHAEALTKAAELAKTEALARAGTLASGTEALAKAEALAEAEALAKTEALASAEALAKAEAAAQADARSSAEALAKARELAQADAQASAEALAEAEARTKAEEFAKNEALVRAAALADGAALAKAEALASAEALAKAQELAKADGQASVAALAKVEALAKAEELAKNEALARSEALAKAEALARADGLANAEALAQAKEIARAAAVTAAGALAQAEALADREALAKAEALSKVEALAKAEALARAEANARDEDANHFLAENEKLEAQLTALRIECDALAERTVTLDEKTATAAAAAMALQKMTAQKEQALSELARTRAELTQTTTKSRQEFENLQERLTGELAAKNEEVQKLRAAPTPDPVELKKLRQELETARSSSNATIDGMRVESKKAAAERALLTAEFSKFKSDAQAEKERLENELAAVREVGDRDARDLAETKASEANLAYTKKTLTDEVASLRTARDLFSNEVEDANAAHAAKLAALTSERDDLRQELDAVSFDLLTTRTLAADLDAEKKLRTAEHLAAHDVAEKEIADLTRQRDGLQANLEALTQEFATAKQDHGLAFAALDRDRDSLRAAKEALAAEFGAARSTHAKTVAELRVSHDTLAAKAVETEQRLAEAVRRGEDLEARLEKSEAALAEALASLQKGEEDAARQAHEHAETLANLIDKQERGMAALAAEKDAALAKIASEKATLLADVDDRLAALEASHEEAVQQLHEKQSAALHRLTEEMNSTVAALTVDRDKVRDALAAAERHYPAEIAVLVEARDSAQRDSAAVAERLAEISVEASQKYAHLSAELEAVLAERQKLTEDFAQARDNHKVQAGVFASEFKTVVRQRDDFIAQLETERRNLATKTAAFERDRAALNVAEEEMKTRTAREIARIRRERDTIVRQRDVLRARIERLIADQRQMLDEMTSQAAFTTMKHHDSGITAHEMSDDEDDEPAPPPKARDPKPREPRKKEANIIDITEAEIITPMQGGVGRLNIPRVRPVVIPPPQVRSL